MIGTVMRIGILHLKRGRVDLLLTFVLPIAFFSIFAFIFGNMGSSKTPKVEAVVVDLDGTPASGRFVAALMREAALEVQLPKDEQGSPRVLTRDDALAMVRTGEAAVVVLVQKGFGDSFGSFQDGSAAVELLADSSNPIAPQMVSGLIQKVGFTAMQDVFLERGIQQFETFAGGLTDAQRLAVDTWLPLLRQQVEERNREADDSTPDETDSAGAAPAAGMPGGLVNVAIVDVIGEKKENPTIAFYAAGIAVMFMLFSASGAGGTLLEEEQNGTLERLLSTRLTMGQLLFGKWLFLTLVCVVQVVVMFTWGQLIFGLDLMGHLPGFFLITSVTAASASGLGLLLATLCRSRGQLAGLSTILILSMSALGGSMVPRFILPPLVKKIGLITFNAWALDGFNKVFWLEVPLIELWPQVAVLGGLAVLFMVLARWQARRWETI
jgi:ABC-2 type transport system permease protein